MYSKRRLPQLQNARLAKEKVKKQRVEQLLQTTQSCDKPLRIDTNNLDNLNNLKSAT